MNYDEFGSIFQRSFIGGSYDTFEWHGGNVAFFTKLKLDKNSVAIDEATVIFNQDGQTRVIDEGTKLSQSLKPVSREAYILWKDLQNEILRDRMNEELKAQAKAIEDSRLE